MTKYFVDAVGNYLGGFDGAGPQAGAIEVPNPPAHGLDVWDGVTFLTPLIVKQDNIRGKRNFLLSEADHYQGVLYYEDLTTTQQMDLAQYRSDLLGIPQQIVFNLDPDKVTWPIKPTWF
jgi:hypothetical protein